jgi:hypothetical protein
MDLLFTGLGAIDIIAAALLWMPLSETLVLYVMIFMLAKGTFFLITSLASKSLNPLFTGLCVTDILTGIALSTMVLGYSSLASVAGMVGLIRVVSGIKGLYSLGVSLM